MAAILEMLALAARKRSTWGARQGYLVEVV